MRTEEQAASEALRADVARHCVRFVDVQPDWSAFTPVKLPGNERAIFQYVGPNGHGQLDPWALPAEHFSVYLVYVPPGGGAPYHQHAAEEVFTVLEGRVSFWWERDGVEAEIVLGPKDLLYCPAHQRLRFVNTGVEGAWLHVALGGQAAPPQYDLERLLPPQGPAPQTSTG
ncbi:MAG TPA: cupin domain-containing protein [Chloroflexota bacterium]|jgi:mannose-6-phosphate isomerase-like protein (cupin superfamily)|nr:cupin domain-containing protein [Chloroflexota bacterium]